MRAILVSCLLLAAGCARDWPVPVRNFSHGRVAVNGATGDCRMVAHVLDEPEQARARLGSDFRRTLEEELGLQVPAGASPRVSEADLDRAVDRVAWGQEMGVLLMAGPCHPGLELDRVVQPGTGPSRWELRLVVDPQPGPSTITWILAGAIRGNVPPMAVDEPPQRLRPGRERLTLTARPVPGAGRPQPAPPANP